MTVPREHLLITDPEHDREHLLAGRAAAARHTISPRISLITASDVDVDTLRDHPAVLGIFTDRVPHHLIELLDADEQLFVQAWLLRREPKRRSGDGASWDAEGFEPPDP